MFHSKHYHSHYWQRWLVRHLQPGLLALTGNDQAQNLLTVGRKTYEDMMKMTHLNPKMLT